MQTKGLPIPAGYEISQRSYPSELLDRKGKAVTYSRLWRATILDKRFRLELHLVVWHAWLDFRYRVILSHDVRYVTLETTAVEALSVSICRLGLSHAELQE
ncbi:hypothetical protein NM688_g2827 [Phlebia brevispora]|uniref:Uncharacterized protein n=1 Tax=Phlebia brevispora TaxID=194682 RepID=A0ACC1T7Q5_9APHY|nr:hypothetical protein NM688_g2827 [Phlebia brevispora]